MRRKCINCGSEFEVNKKHKKFCSFECRKKYHNSYEYKKKSLKLYYIRHKKRLKKYYKKKWHEKYKNKYKNQLEIKRTKIMQLIGESCVICNTKKNVIFHEKHGSPHEYKNSNKKMRYYLENYKDFMPLCSKCHTSLHWLAKTQNFKTINELMNLLKSTN